VLAAKPDYISLRLAGGRSSIVEDEELEAIEIESTHVIEIDSFVQPIAQSAI
jgi:non-homologous end joining protein Ku